LESETLSGWGIGKVVAEPSELQPRAGQFPRSALSKNPAPEPTQFAHGAHARVVEEFKAPAGGYISTRPGDELIIKHQVYPFVWAWVEDLADPNHRGWAPEAILRSL